VGRYAGQGQGIDNSRRKRHFVYTAIAVFMTCAVLAPVPLAILSSRPHLYVVRPKRNRRRPVLMVPDPGDRLNPPHVAHHSRLILP